MNKYLLISDIIVILLIVSFSGCTTEINHPDTNKFIGTWELDVYNSSMDCVLLLPVPFVFESDGTLVLKGLKAGTWSVKRNRLEIYISGPEGSGTFVFEYTFSEGDTTLILTPVGGYSCVCHKKG